MAERKPKHEQHLYVKLPSNEYCIDSILISRSGLVITKETEDATRITPNVASTLKTVADFLDALPIILSDKLSDEKVEENIIYSRHNVPVVNKETFRELISGTKLPLVYFTHGGVYVKVNGSKLKELREKVGLSRGELAWRIGVSNKAIANYEEGESDVSLEVAWKLEEIFGDEIFEELSMKSLKEIFNEKIKALEIEPRDVVLRALFSELREYGFRNYVFLKAPFDAGVKFVQEKIKIKIAIKKEPASEEVELASEVSEKTQTPLVVISSSKEDVEGHENLFFVQGKDPHKIRDVILRIYHREEQRSLSS
ncbi:MAG: helix-turn-helix domain-containing protein [Infirmifilum sp.]